MISNLLALSSLAVFLCSSAIAPVAALATPGTTLNARHAALAVTMNKAKRNTHRKRCKARAVPGADAPAPHTDNGTGPSNQPPVYNTPTTPPPTSTPPSASGKKGLAWPNGDADLHHWASVNWIYTWSPDCPASAKDLNIECVPMMWGWKDVDHFKDVTSRDGYARIALGMNEPNQFDQSSISPEDGARLWKDTLEPLKQKGYRLGSPSTTSAPSGKQWIKDFFKACNGGCSVDFITLHWYDKGVQKFKDYVTDFHDTFNMNIWVTEYACQDFNGGEQCSEGEIWNFLQETVQWMEATPWIERYAWFGAMRDMTNVNYLDQIMDPSSGGANNLGKAYLGY
jgi:hypothetical protein